MPRSGRLAGRSCPRPARTSPRVEFNLITTSAYYPNGALWKTTDPAGHVTERFYDRAGRLDTVVASGGRATISTYDRNGRITRQVFDPTDPSTPRIELNRVTTNQYDLMGRRTATVVDPDALALASGVVYDRLGRQIESTNPNTNSSYTSYDAAGRMTSLSDDGSPAATLTMAYDAAGRVTGITDPLGAVTHTGYDAAGNQLTRTVAFSSSTPRTWTREYDLTGSVTRLQDPNGNDIRYSYDRVGRLAEIYAPGTPNVSYAAYAYDTAGRTTGITNYTGSVAYTYDELGRTTQVTSPQGTIGYAYNAIGQRTSMTLPGSRTVSYSYDPTTADLATISDWSTAPAPTEYTWTADGRIDTITRPTGTGTPAEDLITTYGYDTAGRLTGISHSQNSSYLAEFGYTLDANGNRTQVDITGAALPTGNEQFTYNSRDQLTYAKYVDNGTATFAYDANGNRTTVSAGGVTTTYTYDDLGQLSGITDNNPTPLNLAIAYDPNGNRISVSDSGGITRSYSWDWDNRLTAANLSGATTDYAYLGDDTRAEKTVGSTTTDYLVDRSGGLPQVVDDGTTASLHDVTGNSVSIDSSDTPTYPLADALGSTRLTVDDTGTLIGTNEWDAWGNQRSSTGTNYGFGWTGQQYDPSSDLTYLRARYYSSGTASFLSRDTVQPNAGGPTGYNPYAYANGNPATSTDPSGHFGIPGFPAVGVFLLLALLFECYISGLCRYATQHADEWANSAVQGAMSAAQWGAVAIAIGISTILFDLYPIKVGIPRPISPVPGDDGDRFCKANTHFDQCGSESVILRELWDYLWEVEFELNTAEFSQLKCATGQGLSMAQPVTRAALCTFGSNSIHSGFSLLLGGRSRPIWDDNLCSIPEQVDWTIRFQYTSHIRGCMRHDFGYANFESALFPDRETGESLRLAVDSKLYQDIVVSCQISFPNENTCIREAVPIYSAVRLFGKSHWSG